MMKEDIMSLSKTTEAKFDAEKFEIVLESTVPEHVWKTINERINAIKKALFSIPEYAPEYYWEMECNKEQYVLRLQQYAEEWNKIMEQFGPIIASYPPKIVLKQKDFVNGTK